MRLLPLFLGLLAPIALPMAPAQAQTEPVTLHYQERPPYYQTRPEGGAQGLVVDPLLRALARAGLPYRLALTPSQRQLLVIEGGAGLDCGIGWFRNPAREAKGQFSLPLYRDQPLGLLVRSSLPWPDGQTLREAVLQRQDVRLLVKQGFSYGPQFDALLAQRSTALVSSTAEVPTLMRMLVADRADWMPVAPEEGAYLMAAAQDLHRDSPPLRLLRFADAPPGNSRHLYCNKAVPADWLQRLDEALK